MRNTRVHLPLLFSLPEYAGEGRKVEIPTDLPILFLAGPIRNAPAWHSVAIRHAMQQDHALFIACPAREVSQDLRGFVEEDKPEYASFHRQRAWEQHYMYGAAETGCILFWLCRESPIRLFPEKVYAHITMLELGKWLERKKLQPETRLVIGTDGGFPEWPTIRYEIESELPRLPIYYSLEETVDAAIKIATPTVRSDA
jgi:hypothetical protein